MATAWYLRQLPFQVSPYHSDDDQDGHGNECDACTDFDSDDDSPANTCAPDNCPYSANADQADVDGDGAKTTATTVRDDQRTSRTTTKMDAAMITRVPTPAATGSAATTRRRLCCGQLSVRPFQPGRRGCDAR
jgi:hypothetical protein